LFLKQERLRKVSRGGSFARLGAAAKHSQQSRKQAVKDVADNKEKEYVARVEKDQHADGNGQDYGAHAAAASADSFET
jgi:hypothetical protein